MILLYLNWTTIFENSISGLIGGSISGLIIGSYISYVGKSIWKKQFDYTNKREIFDELVPLIYDYFSKLLVTQSYIGDAKFNKSLSNLTPVIISKLNRFEAFFGEGFKEEFIKMQEMELSIKSGKEYSMKMIYDELQPVIDKFKSAENQIKYS